MSGWLDADAAERLRHAVLRLDAWIERNGWAGYDPYDVRGTRLGLALDRRAADGGAVARFGRRVLHEADARWPAFTRRLLGVRRRVNAKAMALFARAYLDLSAATGERRFEAKALECLDWLLENPAAGYAGLCWGYPFDWRSRTPIPRGTPSGVVTCTAGDAFWAAYRVTGADRFLDACASICEFLAKDLNVIRVASDCVCFSYTPLDDFRVHNANLLVAEFLVRTGVRIGERRWVDLGGQAAEYALREQNPDGSLYYWGRAQNRYAPNHLDHYHSGFEIRALHGLWRTTADARYRIAAERYYGFYRENFFEPAPDGLIPKHRPDAIHPIDVHACAEALLCSAAVRATFADADGTLAGALRWILTHMQTDDGWFVYRIVRRGKRERAVPIPFIRWGQAWMLAGLGACVAACREPTVLAPASGGSG